MHYNPYHNPPPNSNPRMKSFIEQAIASGVHNPNYYQGGGYFGDAPTEEDLMRAGVGGSGGGRGFGDDDSDGEFNPAAAIAGGAALLGDAISMGNQRLGLDTSHHGVQRSATGQPIYTVGQQYSQASGAKPQGATAGEVLGGVGKGAAAGTKVLPVLGTVIGAAVGGLTSALGGGIRKRKQQREKDKALNTVKAAQEEFNEASQFYDKEQIAQTEYRRRRNMTNRLYNLYSTPQTIGY